VSHDVLEDVADHGQVAPASTSTVPTLAAAANVALLNAKDGLQDEPVVVLTVNAYEFEGVPPFVTCADQLGV